MMQCLFDFKESSHLIEDYDFIVSLCNSEAYNAIALPHMWYDRRFILIGDEKSGKTSMINGLKNRIDLPIYQMSIQEALSAKIAPDSIVVLQDITHISEDELFHFFNWCKAEKLYLIIVLKALPKFSLPDLKSRFFASYIAYINNPDNSLAKKLIEKYFRRHQLNLSEEIAEYISNRIPRDYNEIYNLVELLNKKSMSEGRPISIPFIKETGLL